MAAVNWGMLAKSQVDPEKIEEAIARLILEHNEDEEAHLGPGQSLQSHKAAEIIDHLVASIIADKIKNKEVTGIKLDSSAQVGEVVVAPEGGDYTSIQAALDAGKKRIYVKAGTYEVSSPILVASDDILIRGEDKDTTIIKLANGANCAIIQIGDEATNRRGVVIEELQIDGNYGNQTETHPGIHLFGFAPSVNVPLSKISEVTIKDCIIKDVRGFAIDLDTGYNCLITGNRFKGGGTFTSDIHLEYSKYNTISNNIFESTSDYQCFIQKSYHNLIVGNQVLGALLSSIYLDFQADYNIIKGNQILSAGYGIYFASGKYNCVIGNFFRNCTTGIYLTSADSNLIDGNYVAGCTSRGIWIFDAACDKNLVVGNYLINNNVNFTDGGTGTEAAHNYEV